MKIGIVTEYFYPTLGGITENVYHMARELLRLGHDFRIITGYQKQTVPLPSEILERVIHIGWTTPTFFNGSCGRATTGFNLTKKMKEVFRREKFDILHLHSPVFPTLPAIANMQADAPLIATYHTCTDNLILYKLGGYKIRALMDRIAGHVAVSQSCADDVRRFFDYEFDVIPNGVDVNWWAEGKKMSKFDDGKINILFLGRPDTRNGLDVLIRAFTAVHRKFKNSRLIVVGDGPLRFFFEGMVPHEIKNSILFEGPATDTRRDYLASSHVMCFLPSIASFGITILEGMSGGAAMLASDIEPFRALVTSEESALLVPPSDACAVATALERLISDEELRQKLGTTAASRVEHYDWKRVAGMYVDYYKKKI